MDIKTRLIVTSNPLDDIRSIVKKHKNCLVFLDKKFENEFQKKLREEMIEHEKYYTRYSFKYLTLRLSNMNDKWCSVLGATLYDYFPKFPFSYASDYASYSNISIPKEIIFIKMKEE